MQSAMLLVHVGITYLLLQDHLVTVIAESKGTGTVEARARVLDWHGRALQLERKASRHQHKQLNIPNTPVVVSQSQDDLISQFVRENRVESLPADHWSVDRPELQGGITRILHQSWKSRELPAHFKHWQGSWRANHPGWEYRLWTDQDNRDLVVRSGTPVRAYRNLLARSSRCLMRDGGLLSLPEKSGIL